MSEGIIVRDSNGRFQKGTVSPKPITHDNAREMLEKRAQKAAQRSRQRIVREAAAIDPDVRDIFDAHALMLARQYIAILDSDKPRMDDAEKLAQMLGTAERKGAATAATMTVQAGEDDVIMLVMRRRLQAEDVIEGEVAE